MSLAACGLQNYTYYDPPDFSYDQGILTLRDSGNVLPDDPNFRGYEIFYRVYSDSQLARDHADSDLSYLLGEAAKVVSGTGYPDIFVQNAISRGYVRMRHLSDSDEPLICPTGTNLYYVHLQSTSQPTSEWYLDQDIPHSTQTTLGRTLSNNTSTEKLSFYKRANYEVRDQDYDAGGTDTTNNLHFVFFAVGYWLDENFTQHYGLPRVIDSVVDYVPQE
jgi:hypothetical protein